MQARYTEVTATDDAEPRAYTGHASRNLKVASLHETALFEEVRTVVEASDDKGIRSVSVLRAASPRVQKWKRICDLVLVLLLAVPALFLSVLIVLWIRLESPGPALFAQHRPGLNGDLFKIYKFRTMYMDAECRFAALPPELQEEFLRHGKIRNDPRITRIGRWLRRTSLDELPQLWNVIKGDMHLVGPRTYLVEQLPQVSNRDVIMCVKPGVTGLWQVSGRSELTFEKRLELDAHYVQHWSARTDFSILWRTVGVVVKGSGAY